MEVLLIWKNWQTLVLNNSPVYKVHHSNVQNGIWAIFVFNLLYAKNAVLAFILFQLVELSKLHLVTLSSFPSTFKDTGLVLRGGGGVYMVEAGVRLWAYQLSLTDTRSIGLVCLYLLGPCILLSGFLKINSLADDFKGLIILPFLNILVIVLSF